MDTDIIGNHINNVFHKLGLLLTQLFPRILK